jgi:hypothetical protein
MSILKRPGWNNYELLEEGRLHNDKLKDKIGKMFDRLSLGYSPSHVVDKISRIIRAEKGDKFDFSKLSDDYIMNIATSNEVTRGKFTPSLRPSYVNSYQNTNPVELSDPSIDNDVSIDFTSAAPTPETNTASIAPHPSVSYQEDAEEKQPKFKDTPKIKRDRDLEEKRLKREREARLHDRKIEEEDAEEVDTCGCEKHDSVFSSEIPKKDLTKINKESVKLSPKAVNNLLREQYIKRKQHQFRFEERYRNY